MAPIATQVGYEFDIVRKQGGGACESSTSDRPVQPEASRASLCVARTLLKHHRTIPGHSIAAVRALKKRSLWTTAGGKWPLKLARNLIPRRPIPCARESVPSYEQYNHHVSPAQLLDGRRS